MCVCVCVCLCVQAMVEVPDINAFCDAIIASQYHPLRVHYVYNLVTIIDTDIVYNALGPI